MVSNGSQGDKWQIRESLTGEFNELAARWRAETEHLASTAQ